MTPSEALEIFGLNNINYSQELKSTYHRLAKECHPDVGGDEEKFKKVSQAYQVLTEMLSQQEAFRESFRFHRYCPRYPTDEELIVANLCVSIADIKQGRVIDLAYKKSVTCKTCQDSEKTHVCENCGGSGYTTVDERISVEIKGARQHVSVS